MILYQNGNFSAFEVIYSRYRVNVFSYLKKRLQNKETLEDVFQRIFLKFHKSKDLYNKEYPLLNWLYVICRSELIDTLRKEKMVLIELKEENLEVFSETEKSFIDLDCEDKLTSKEKKALEFRYYLEKEYSEISKLLSISESNSRKIVSRALKKLRLKYLKEI